MHLETLKAVVKSKEGLKVEAESKGFKIIMNEPVEEGGTLSNNVEMVRTGAIIEK